jgi:hypothetical protein
MKKCLSLALVVLAMSSFTQAQYNGKYVTWSQGYLFNSKTFPPSAFKAFTELVNFQVTVSSNGSISLNSLSMSSTAFVDSCHVHGDLAEVCIGGAGQSNNFISACGSASTQATLVHNIVNLVRQYGYDGVDLDWEEAETGGFEGNPAQIAMFAAFHKQIRDSVNAMNPKPMFTAAISTSWYPNGTIAIAPYVDQLNNMSYYNNVSAMDGNFQPVVSKGIAKSKLSVGFGWDTDNEITDPNDILAKCRYAITNGYAGIMAWDIARAPTITTWILDSISRYVTHASTAMAEKILEGQCSSEPLFVWNSGAAQTGEIMYLISADAAGKSVDLSLYDMRGILVKTLVHAPANPGVFRVRFVQNTAGAYVVKLSSGSKVRAAKTMIIR